LARPLLKINCHSRTRRNLLRLCGLTFPVWGIAAVFCLVSWSGGADIPARHLWAASFAYLAGLAGTCALLRPNLVAEGGNLIFPGIRRRRFALEKLKSLSVRNGVMEFCFQGDDSVKQLPAVLRSIRKRQAEDRVVRLAVSRLSQQDRILLLEFLSDHAGACLISEEDRRLLEAGELLPGFDPGKPASIPYDSHTKLKAFYEVCLNYERMFWCVFLGGCSPFVLFMLPLLAYLPYSLSLRLAGLHADLPAQFKLWFSLWEPLAKYGVTPVASSMLRYQQFIQSHFLLACLLLALAALLVLQLLRLLARPTAVVLSPEGLQLESKNLGLRFALCRFAWKDLKAVALQKSSRSLHHDQLVFCGKKGSPLVVLDLKSLSRTGCRQLLKKAVQAWAPGAEIDPGFMETAAAPRKSYTELWLSSLNTPPRRDRLAPLRRGACLKAGSVRILDTIGAGGQGVAYLAEYVDPLLDLSEEVVVKEFILPVYVDRRARLQALERFEHEARVLSSLGHEHIVGLKDHFIEDHRAYLILERIKGQSLRKLASGKGLRDEELLRKLTRQMCEVLSCLHSQSPPVVHRDFTPDNLMLAQGEVLKLIDFNVAYQSSGEARTSVVGKHAYMPPEQFAGRPCVESDIYALGATLYYLLAGSDPEPFCQYGTPPDCLELSPVWHEIIRGCTALELTERFHSPSEIIALLDGTSSTGSQPAAQVAAETAGVLSTTQECRQPLPVAGTPARKARTESAAELPEEAAK
jgi:tRNA A-37 threonylcarbamoyl transferase component Bud32